MSAPKEPSRRSGISKANIDTELHQRARSAVRIVRRKTGRNYTVAQFYREAVRAQLALISRDYHAGREIPPDEAPLEPGSH